MDEETRNDELEPELPSFDEENPSGGESENGAEEAVKWTPSEKKNAETVIKGKKSPQKLNKNLILISFFALVGVFLLVTQVILPLIPPSRDKKKDSRSLSEQNFTDYSRFAPQKMKVEETVFHPPPRPNDQEILDNLPPVNFYEQKVEPAPALVKEPAPSVPRAKSHFPSTIADPLQGKIIAGIKGLTPTQKEYQENLSPAPGGNAPPLPGLPSWEEYRAQALKQYESLVSAPPHEDRQREETRYERQNNQTGKLRFYENERFDEAGQGSWIPLNAVWMGTIFEAVLLGEINTDLPGEISAVVSKNIYSSQNGAYLLIPQNSRLIGSYNSSISYAQSRVQAGWHTLIRPDGYEVKLGNMSATDSKGAAGLKGWVNDHWGQKLLGLALVSAFSIGRLEAKSQLEALNNPSINQLWQDDQALVYKFAEEVIGKTLNVQPTIVIKAGTKINVVVNSHLTLPPVKDFPVTERYKR
jgi:type IV secretion system protein VirB10